MSFATIATRIRQLLRMLSRWLIPHYEYGPSIFIGQVTAVSTKDYSVDICCERVWCKHYDLVVPQFMVEPCCYKVHSICRGFIPERLQELFGQQLTFTSYQVRNQDYGSELESCINLYLDRLGVQLGQYEGDLAA